MLANAEINNSEYHIDETTPQQLMKSVGLTEKEAKAWLKKEPNFSSDASYHEPKNRRKVTRTY